MTTKDFKEQIRAYFKKNVPAEGPRINSYERFTLIGAKKLDNGEGGEIIRYFRLGDFGSYYGVCATAKANARSGKWYKQHIFDNASLFIVGIANGYDGALSLIERIAEEAYEKTGEVNLRKFLLDRQEEFEKKEIRSV